MHFEEFKIPWCDAVRKARRFQEVSSEFTASSSESKSKSVSFKPQTSGSILDAEDGGTSLLQYVGSDLPDYTTAHPRRQ
jgi:hypothetical protein